MHALIEDEYLVAMALADDLRNLGYDSVEIAVNEKDAIAAALRVPPDLITADFSLAQGTGVGAVQAIYKKSQPAVVFISSSPERVLREISAAIALSKPYCSSELANAVQMAVHRMKVPFTEPSAKIKLVGS